MSEDDAWSRCTGARSILGDEPIDEPPRRLDAEARRLTLEPDRVWILRYGETRSW